MFAPSGAHTVLAKLTQYIASTLLELFKMALLCAVGTSPSSVTNPLGVCSYFVGAVEDSGREMHEYQKGKKLTIVSSANQLYLLSSANCAPLWICGSTPPPLRFLIARPAVRLVYSIEIHSTFGTEIAN